ncbi:hypothetical protein ACFX2H_023349 [Malus domestica]
MESDEEQDCFRGLYPEYGAIFMSSSATIYECFERRLFGLPSSQGQFFPAQVKVKLIWRCHSLSEPEFSGAIKDNYFSNWKFRFGLSKAQGQLSSKREPISVDTAGRVKEVDDGKSVLSDKAINKLVADNHNGPKKKMSQSPWNVSGNIGKEDGGMLASDEVGNLHEVDKKVGKIMQRVYLGPVPGEVGKLDAAFAMSEKVGNEFNVDVESVSSEHPMSDQSGRGDDDLIRPSRTSASFTLMYLILPLRFRHSAEEEQ